MKIFLLFITIFLTLTFAFPAEKKLSKLNKNQELHLKLQKRVKQAAGCRINICYAIDGSGSINSTEFLAQRGFILDTTGLLSLFENTPRGAGVQYSSAIEPVSPLTEVWKIFSLLVNLEQHPQEPSYISGGIHYCADLLYPRKGDVNGIVLLTDGKNPFGGDPVIAANRFRDEGGEMFVVSTGLSDPQKLLDIAGGDATKVLRVHNFIDAMDLVEHLGELAAEKCEG